MWVHYANSFLPYGLQPMGATQLCHPYREIDNNVFDGTI